MAITKQFLKSKPTCKVTFQLATDAVANVSDVALLGEFNDWSLDKAVALKKQKDGSYKTTLELETGKEYQFRYLLDGDNWTNDSTADKYVSNGISADENSVVSL